MQTIKSNRQVNYQPHQLYKNESRITRETPLSVGLGLHFTKKLQVNTFRCFTWSPFDSSI